MRGRFQSWLNTSVSLLEQYRGDIPFHYYLKQFFSANRKYGSGDRKQIASLCYGYFRLGRAAEDSGAERKILAAVFLCRSEPQEILDYFEPGWNNSIHLTLKDKIDFLLRHGIRISIDEIFPMQGRLSSQLEEDRESFVLSHFTQPDLFLRVRPGKREVIASALHSAHIPFHEEGNAFRLQNSAAVDRVIALDRDAVVQDISSQRTGSVISEAIDALAREGKSPGVWDCCAASGGKSLLLHDLYPDARITVSDIRPSILSSLERRFSRAGMENYRAFTADLTAKISIPGTFNCIMADVPCSGSGTWGRTPEQMRYFSSDDLDRYIQLQRTIIGNIARCLEAGGQLLYFTCSVYREENEGAVDYLREKFGMKIASSGIIRGYNEKADTMFAARLISPA